MTIAPLNWVKERWETIASLAAWLTGIVAAFVIAPPSLRYYGEDPTAWLRLCQVVLAIAIGLFFLDANPGAKARRRFRYVAVAATLLGIILFVAYQALAPQWACTYRGVRVIAGATLSRGAADYLAGHASATCDILIKTARGFTERVWPMEELVTRWIALCALYSLAVLSLSTAIMATIQSMRRPRDREAG